MNRKKNTPRFTGNGVSRRSFISALGTGVAALATSGSTKQAHAFFGGGDKSKVGFVTSNDQRAAAYNALKPIEDEIKDNLGNRRVVIKINSGQVKPEWWLNATDPDFTRGIIDFFREFYGGPIHVAESTAAGATSTHRGLENYGFMPILDEYENVEFDDLNEHDTVTHWILDEKRHPRPIEVIDTYVDPDVYMISATRIKSHNCVIATLGLKNIVMGAPINHFRQASRENRNEKAFMHGGGNRGLSYNMFRLAMDGVYPDLTVLDGVVGMEGNGPVHGTPIEQGVALASQDCIAADRIGCELMNVDYSEVKYLQWCAKAGLGKDDLENIKVIGPDYRDHIMTYKQHENIEKQREWIVEDYVDEQNEG